MNKGRKVHKYKLIKYLPYPHSDEFLYIGVILKDKVKLLQGIDLYAFKDNLGSRDKLLGMLSYLNELGTVQEIGNGYLNNYRLVDRVLGSDLSDNELLEDLFYSYVGFKIDKGIE
jgi:hypothetical protein